MSASARVKSNIDVRTKEGVKDTSHAESDTRFKVTSHTKQTHRHLKRHPTK